MKTTLLGAIIFLSLIAFVSWSAGFVMTHAILHEDPPTFVEAGVGFAMLSSIIVLGTIGSVIGREFQRQMGLRSWLKRNGK